MAAQFVPALHPIHPDQEDAWAFICRDRDVLLLGNGHAGTVPTLADLRRLAIDPDGRRYLGHYGRRDCYALTLPSSWTPPDGNAEWMPLRRLFGQFSEDLAALCGRAAQLIDWDRDHRFCSRCGTAVDDCRDERAKRCPCCGLLAYPPLAPAVIVRVERGDRLLLARSPRFPKGLFSVLAGFVEPGETLEQAVAREIQEEVGLEVIDVRYFGSQPWPFPHSLMLAFTACHAGGEIQVDGKEIEAADWYAADRLPPIPGPGSIARQLIDGFLAKHRKGVPDDGS